MSKIASIKHGQDKRAHIPSKEEAGMETGADASKKTEAQYPLNPVTHRGQDPELYWLNKYGNDDREQLLKVDIRSLYRHEHISPELLIRNLYKVKEGDTDQLDLFSLFGNTIAMDEEEKVADYYHYSDDWKNRLIQGDSLLVMSSLLEREGMAGKVQTIYLDPPYGIKYGSNWQMRINSRDVKDANDENLSGEPEMIKAFRDTWELGIHSYLSYLRDRLLIAKEMLTDSGSCFVQISDENLHLVRNIMDEVFGSENFVAIINFKTMMPLESGTIESVFDYVVWYSRSKENLKYRNLYISKTSEGSEFVFADEEKNYRKLSHDEIKSFSDTIKKNKVFKRSNLSSSGYTPSCSFPIDFKGEKFNIAGGKSWRTNKNGIDKLIAKNRIFKLGTKLYFKLYWDDFPFTSMINSWSDTIESSSREYVVQTTTKVIQRCILMTTDPGDLVLDPTCGSGTTAFVAEQWGRRWITIDTSRIALNIAKTRLTTATFPYYELYDQQGKDIRQGFIYKKVPHVTLKSLANDEPPEEETLYDQPKEDKKKLRVAGPFTMETLQNFEPASPDSLEDNSGDGESIGQFEERIFEHLKSAGIKNGIKNENAVFHRIEHKADAYLNAEGFYSGADGKEKKAYFHIGPKFGTVSRQAVNEAIKACRGAGDADWLVILGFSFEAEISNQSITRSAGSFEVTKVRMHDDLMQEGLLKKDKKAASFVTIGEPDIVFDPKDQEVVVEIRGLDIYDPIRDEVKARSVADIAYWMVDDDYDSSNFIVKQIFFCGGDKDEFDKWKKGLSNLVKESTKKKAEQTLKIELDEEAFDRLYGFRSHPIAFRKGRKVAVRVISQFGEESMKVLTM